MAQRSAELAEKLQRWRQERSRLNGVLERLEIDKVAVVQSMRSAGIETADDLKKSPVNEAIADELLEVEKQAKAIRSKVCAHDDAIARLESGLRRLERRKLLEEAGVSDKELDELVATTLELDETLKGGNGGGAAIGIELEKVVNEALKKPAQ